ncbi:MAG: bifunctional adenosylcobinamide kinase/adenosylcobinamide-phosphate guanylyltransferase [Nitrospirae bacterium]|nr:bifunctional adenosylcobinamide kinase/adenosylcobinamide-phosphate guanylyltransferase [Nitrospirota bacterium]
MGKIVFVLGGARSGKSGFALKAASAIAGSKAYIATAQALDAEMQQRIDRHKAERSGDWQTFEEPVNIHDLIVKIHGTFDVLLVDCLTLWISNLLLNNISIEGMMQKLVDALKSCSSSVFVVSNEVGLGIVPENRLAREFRDMSGTLNQKVAAISDEVYFLAAGLPIRMKP